MNNIKKKGFTILEMIVTMAILFIVLGIIFPFFNSNYRTLNKTEIRSDFHREGNKAGEYITNKAMQSKNIEALKDSKGKDILETKQTAELGEITFITDSSEKYTFYLENNTLKYFNKDNKEDSVDISNNIESIKVEAIENRKDGEKETDVQEVSFKDCRGIYISISYEKQDENYTIDNKIYFRNNSKE